MTDPTGYRSPLSDSEGMDGGGTQGIQEVREGTGVWAHVGKVVTI